MESEKKPFAWQAVSYVLTLIVAPIIVVIYTFWYQDKEPHLVTIQYDSIPFRGEKLSVGSYRVTILNDGNKEATKIVCSVRIPGARITDRRLVDEPKTLDYKLEASGDTLKLTIARLNPKRLADLDIQAESATKLPTRPEVEAEADGVVAVKRASLNDTNLAGSQSSPTWLIYEWGGALFAFLMMANLCIVFSETVMGSLQSLIKKSKEFRSTRQ